MKNNMASPPATLQQTNVVYKFTCPFPHSKAEDYIGFTQTTLSRRLTMHGQNGSINRHFMNDHNIKPTREQLTSNTIILTKANDRYKLAIKEALLIMNNAPSLNIQFDNFTNILKLYNHRDQQSKQTNSIRYSSLSTSNNPSLPKDPSSPTLSECTSSPSCPSPPPALNVPENHCKPSLVETYELQSIAYTDPSTPKITTTQYSMTSNSHDEVLPDFNQVLLKFGIECCTLKQVPLKEYHWQKFHNSQVLLEHSPYPPCDQNSPTISQRIRTMVRGARKDSTASQT